MKLTIAIDMDNAAFGDSDVERAAEVAAILNKVTRYPEDIAPGSAFNLRDSNGNTVGRLKITR